MDISPEDLHATGLHALAQFWADRDNTTDPDLEPAPACQSAELARLPVRCSYDRPRRAGRS